MAAKAKHEAFGVGKPPTLGTRPSAAKPLLQGEDYGDPIPVPAELVGFGAGPRGADERSIATFLDANREALERLQLEPEIRAGLGGAPLRLRPGGAVGAVSLRAASTRRVVAGLLVRPRFPWESVGQVLGATAYRVEPQVGGGPLVPGSSREVPPYIIAGPVLSRLAALVEHMTRGFVEVSEDRARPRGHVDWNVYGLRSIPRGDWQRFRCTFPDLADDPAVLSAVRWTLRRLLADLERASESVAARTVIEIARLLDARVGPGPQLRPDGEWLERATAGREGGEWLRAAIEGMCWVADERGLGGSRTLDGLPWSLAVDRLWEAWVESFLEDLAPRLGARLLVGRKGETQRPLVWEAGPRSLTHLVPDFVLQMPGRTIVVDAKYKRTFTELQRVGWAGMPEEMRAAHRADLHQALAYSAAALGGEVSSVLAYPRANHRTDSGAAAIGSASLDVGDRRLRILLGALPFGFPNAPNRDEILDSWRGALMSP